MSFACIIIFDPDIISKEDPAGTGAFLIKKTSSPAVSRKTSTSVLDATLFERRILNKTKVELPLAVTNTVVLALRASVTT